MTRNNRVYNKNVLASTAAVFLLIGLGCGVANGQWATQTITLQPGWNAVFLEVQPEPPQCDQLFANLAVESVWGWNRRFSPVQFIQDTNTLVTAPPDWLRYVPGTNVLAGENSLFSLEGGKCYLIKRPNNSVSTTWVIEGQPTLRRIQWVPNSFNFAGFSLDRTNPPSFQTFFAASPAHTNNPVYRLNSNGTWTQVLNLSTTPMRSGEAFWIQCNGVSDYQGPVNLTIAQRTGLTFGRSVVDQTITLLNASTSSRTYQLSLLASALPPAGNFPALAGPVPLSYWKLDVTNKLMSWLPLNATLGQTNLAPGQTWQVQLAVRRADMLPYAGTGAALYQSLLEVRDLAGSSRLVIPVSAEGLTTSSSPGSRPKVGPSVGPLHPGLWVGSVSINKVSQPASTSPLVPTNTASAFQFRIVVHVDETGQARLLQRVLQMWKPGTYMPDPDDPSKQIVDQPGRFVLVTDESLIQQIPGLTGAALRDDQPVGRRFSTAAFGFRGPIPMNGTGDFGVSHSNFSCPVVLDYDDAVNPFKHRFHPDHDNMDPGFLQKLPEAQESFTVTRQLQFQFTDSDPDNLSLAGWGDNQLGGSYLETITGLHKQPLYIQGTFRLQQASRVSVLNDGLF